MLRNFPIVEHGGRAWVVVWPGLDTHLRSIHHISLGPGGRTVPLEHPMESVCYAKSGGVAASDNSFDPRLDLSTGAMTRIGADMWSSRPGMWFMCRSESGTRCREAVTATSKAWAARVRPIGTCCG